MGIFVRRLAQQHSFTSRLLLKGNRNKSLIPSPAMAFQQQQENSNRSLSTNSPLFKLGKLNHVAIAVPDLEKSCAFYRDILGASVSPVQEQPDHGVYTVFINLGNAKLELLHPLGEKSPIAGFLEKNKNGGMHHICIEVNNIEAAMTQVKEMGIRCLSETTKIGAHGKPVVFLHPKDCQGVLVELEQE